MTMTIAEWKRKAKIVLAKPLKSILGPLDASGVWEEALDALLRASENEGLPILDDLVERLDS